MAGEMPVIADNPTDVSTWDAMPAVGVGGFRVVKGHVGHAMFRAGDILRARWLGPGAAIESMVEMGVLEAIPEERFFRTNAEGRTEVRTPNGWKKQDVAV